MSIRSSPGGARQFSTLRQYKGLSGFQKRHESEHDCWEAGHSSTSLSAALGMAVARDLNGEHYHIVPVIGDGAMASGMSMEALNQIGGEERNMIIIFNDNSHVDLPQCRRHGCRLYPAAHQPLIHDAEK